MECLKNGLQIYERMVLPLCLFSGTITLVREIKEDKMMHMVKDFLFFIFDMNSYVMHILGYHLQLNLRISNNAKCHFHISIILKYEDKKNSYTG